MENKKDNKQIEKQDWEQAQEWEKQFWDRFVRREDGITNLGFLKKIARRVIRGTTEEPSNYWWEEQFENYSFLPDHLEEVIEYGCGPFTNLRLIMNGRKGDHIVASDPLARHYVSYKGHFLAERWKRREYLIDDHPMEQPYFADNVFDLAVCINVLDHVQNWEKCMENFVRTIRPGGYAVFGQELTNEEDLQAIEEIRKMAQSDVGHPHKFPDESIFRPYFQDFEAIIDKPLSREQVRLPDWHFGTWIYAGRKKQ
ncbi:MAG: class I SAM-dependent methyltransferase [Candidatus Sumerlaeia bacterium]